VNVNRRRERDEEAQDNSERRTSSNNIRSVVADAGEVKLVNQLDDGRPAGLCLHDGRDGVPVCTSVPVDRIESDPAHVRRDWSGVYEYIAPDIVEIDESIAEIEMRERKETGYQHLEQLAQSIVRYGMLQPIIARAHPCGAKASRGMMMVISGHRRLEAARLAGLTHVPVILHPSPDGDGHQRTLLQLVENLQRQDLSHIDQARGLYALQVATGARSTEIADWIGTTSQYVGDHLRFLRYPMLVRAVDAGAISFSSAREIMRMPAEMAEHITADVLAGQRYELRDIEHLRSNLARNSSLHRSAHVSELDHVEPRDNTAVPVNSTDLTSPLTQAPADALAAIVSRLDGPSRAILGEALACAAQHRWSCAQLVTTFKLLL